VIGDEKGIGCGWQADVTSQSLNGYGYTRCGFAISIKVFSLRSTSTGTPRGGGHPPRKGSKTNEATNLHTRHRREVERRNEIGRAASTSEVMEAAAKPEPQAD